VDYIPRTRLDQPPPVVPEYKRGVDFDPARTTGHMLIDGEWRPYREVRQLNGRYYWTGAHAEINNVLFPIEETVVTNRGSRIPIADSVTVEGGRIHNKADCEQLDGVWYHRSTLRRLVDSGACVVRYLAPSESIAADVVEVPYVHDLAYALLEDAVEVGCGGWHPMGDTDEWCGDYYPSSWIDDNTFYCESCGERFHNDDYGGDGCCGNCDCCDDEEEHSEYYDSRIKECSCRTANNYPAEENVPLKFGIEFEVESRSGMRPALLDRLDASLPSRYAIYKSDGSLSDYEGVEIVTRPDSPAVHKRIWSSVLDDTLRNLLGITNSCGIHIHVTRAPLSPLRIGRMLVFLNDPRNERLVRKIAGRYNGSYCELRNDKKLADGKRNGYSRYEGLNLTGSRTIEFRLFKSGEAATVNGFLKNIEFVEALLAFTDLAVSGNRLLDTDSFMRFITGRKKDYPQLVKFLTA
jgi:hypothetical protein